MEGRAHMEIKATLEKMQELRLATMGMYCIQPILEDEDLQMTSGMPSHQAITMQDDGSLSNPKKAKVKGGVFMTPIMSH